MSTLTRRREIARRYNKCPINCKIYLDAEIASLSDFFAVFHSLLEPGKDFWFRGHSQLKFELIPSALRYRTRLKRDQALKLVNEMKRFLEIKLPRPPAPDNDLGWIQVAQHYGLPTRLLDWTQNAAVALFFACVNDINRDALVVLMNPIELNQSVDPANPRIFDGHRDNMIIKPYFELTGELIKNGIPTIALNPTWNTERITLQHGAFTLHGSHKFALDSSQASSLLYVPILREHKKSLLFELQRVGLGEMFIFPEAEHVCNHLRRTANL